MNEAVRPTRRQILIGAGAAMAASCTTMSRPVETTGDIKVIARGLAFPEGPLWQRDGSLLFVEILGGNICRIAGGSIERPVRGLTGPNGLAIGPAGTLFVTQNGGRPDVRGHGRVQSGSIARGLTPLYTMVGSAPLDGPNDLVFDREGGFYFTDFVRGALYYAAADGAGLSQLDPAVPGANGIALSPDGRNLYVCQTPHDIRRYRVIRPGVAERAPFAVETDPLHALPNGFRFDSMKVAADGDLVIGAWQAGVVTLSPGGALRRILDCPGYWVTNLAFGGPDLKEMYLSALVAPPVFPSPGPPGTPAWGPGAPPEGVILRVASPVAGLRLNYD